MSFNSHDVAKESQPLADFTQDLVGDLRIFLGQFECLEEGIRFTDGLRADDVNRAAAARVIGAA